MRPIVFGDRWVDLETCREVAANEIISVWRTQKGAWLLVPPDGHDAAQLVDAIGLLSALLDDDYTGSLSIGDFNDADRREFEGQLRQCQA